MGRLEIIFLPDSELILPGKSGAYPALPEVSEDCARVISRALSASQASIATIFSIAYSAFSRPLPGFAVASQLLRQAGFTGQIRDGVAHRSASAALAAGEGVWCVMGTGAACHGADAPLETTDFEFGSSVDAQLADILASGNAAGFLQIDTQRALAAGATLAAAGALAAQRLAAQEGEKREKSVVNSTYELARYGVQYFTASWTTSLGSL